MPISDIFASLPMGPSIVKEEPEVPQKLSVVVVPVRVYIFLNASKMPPNYIRKLDIIRNQLG